MKYFLTSFFMLFVGVYFPTTAQSLDKRIDDITNTTVGALPLR